MSKNDIQTVIPVPEAIKESSDRVLNWVDYLKDYMSLDVIIQTVWIVLTIVFTRLITIFVRNLFSETLSNALRNNRWYYRGLLAVNRTIYPLGCIVFLYVYEYVSRFLRYEDDLVDMVTSLTMAWLIINFVTAFIPSKRFYRWITFALWIVAALNIVGLWDDTINFLDGIKYSYGNVKISLLVILQDTLWAAIFIYATSGLAGFGERQIRLMEEISPSSKELISKFFKFFMYALSALLCLNVIGVKLTALTVFTGAAGLGLGFGLQKVFSNYISSIVLLLDKSIKPGDIIALENLPFAEEWNYGWVKKLTSRYVSIVTRDGREHLIPNERLITEKVENWSHSDPNIRLHIPVGISYEADLHLAMQLMKEAVNEEPRALSIPSVQILVNGFGNSSVNLEVVFWIRDPVNGINNVKSNILIRIWDKFHEHGITLPYPQQDLHIRSLDEKIIASLKDILIKKP